MTELHKNSHHKPSVREELDQPPADVGLHDRLDVRRKPVAQVAQRPARVAEDFAVGVLQQLGQGRDDRVHVEHGAGLPVAQVAQRPRPDFEQGPRSLKEEEEEREGGKKKKIRSMKQWQHQEADAAAAEAAAAHQKAITARSHVSTSYTQDTPATGTITCANKL